MSLKILTGIGGSNMVGLASSFRLTLASRRTKKLSSVKCLEQMIEVFFGLKFGFLPSILMARIHSPYNADFVDGILGEEKGMITTN